MLFYRSNIVFAVSCSPHLYKFEQVFVLGTFVDNGPLLDLASKLVMSFVSPSSEDGSSKSVDNVLQLMLRILAVLSSSGNLDAITSCSQKWAPVFELQNSRYVFFM